MKKKLAALLLAVLMVLTMTACGDSDNSGESAGGSGNASGTIRVALWDNNQLAGLKEIADAWTQQSGIQVEFTVMDWGSYWTMLEAGVSGGEMPDVFWMHSNNADKYMGAGVLLNLNDYIAADENTDLNNYFEGITALYSQNGNQYALPKDHDTIAIVYNKAIFDKYGVAYPTNDWTWEDFAAKAQEISEKGAADGIYGTYCNTGSNQDTWYNIIYSFGGKVISDDKKTSGFDDPNTLKAMQFVADEILPACPTPDSMASTGGDTMFLSGLIGMVSQGSWMVNSYYTADNASDYAWVMMPYEDVNGNSQCDKEERCTIYNGLGWCIYADTKNPDAAYSLISYLSSKEAQTKQSELGVTMAGYIGCSEPFAKAFGDMDVSAFVDIEEQGTLVFRPYSKSTAIWEDDASLALVQAWSAPETMEEVCKQIAADMNKTLSEE